MNARTRVKFCGMTRRVDAQWAVDLGVDALGLVFVPNSPRFVDLDAALAIARSVAPLVQLVALFMDASKEAIERVLRELPIDLLQFHGKESPEFCDSFHRSYVKALAMGDVVDVTHEVGRYARARGVLLDAHRSGEQGGTGQRFDWSAIAPQLAPRIILAGGLGPDNVAQAIRQVRPFAVDVSSGIESAAGVKCPRRMQQFMNEVDRASRDQGRD